MHNDINTNVHVKKNQVLCRFHYPLLPMHETKKIEPLQINGNYPFSQQYLQTQANKIFQSLRDLKKNDDISSSEYLKILNLDENTYILSLKNKLRKPHIFKK
jgi:hypothetical protein